MQIKQHLLDKRVVKRALSEGLLDKALYQKTLDELPDLSHRIQAQAIDSVEHAAPVVAEAPPSTPSNSTTNY